MQALFQRSHLEATMRLGHPNPSHPDYHYYLHMKLLQLCIDERAERLGLWAHSHVTTTGLASNLSISNKLINFYFKLGRVINAGKVFDGMSVRNVVSWTSMVSGYVENGRNERALGVFLEMLKSGVRVNQFGYGSVLRACVGLRDLRVGLMIHGCVVKGRFGGDMFVSSALVDFHAKCGRMEDACRVFEGMFERDLVCWNTIVGGFAVQGYGEEAMRMFRRMMREGIGPDCFSFGSVLRGLAGDGGFLVRISQLHGLIMRLGFASYRSLSGSLINAYAKCGKVDSAHRIYRSMMKKDIICCTSLINGYAQEGNYSRDVLDLFKEMIAMNMRLDGVILSSMLNLCANVASLAFGRQIHALVYKHQSSPDVALGNALVDMYAKCGEIEDANRAFDEMEDKNVVSWTSLISGYGRNGDGHKAIALYREMESEGLKPNDVTFLSLLFACSHSGLTDEGWECFSSMCSKYNIKPRAKHFSCLVDLHARAGLLQDAHDLIQDMKIKPNASLWGAVLGACSTYGNKSLGEVAAMRLCDIDPEKSVNYVVLGSIYAATGAWDNALETRGLVDKRSMKKEPAHSLLQSTTNKPLLLQPS